MVGEEDGRAVRPQPAVTFEVDRAAEEICDVNRNNGRITPLTAGTCVVIARSAETDQYAAGESDPVRVAITRVSPELRWDGYDGEELRAGGDPARPREPQPRVSEARGELAYTYNATPSSICAVNPRTGELTPHREGDCDVTVRSAETDDKFLADEITITVPIGGDPLPECDRIRTVGPLDGGETDTINLDSYCRDPEGEDLRYSDAQSDDPATVTVRLIGSSLTVTAAQTPASDRARVTFTAADPARNKIEARFTVLVEEVLPPRPSITCRPSEPDVGDRVTCTADVQGGEPDDWNWRGGEPSGPSDEDVYRTVFRQAGDQPIYLTVRNAAGSDSGSTTVRVLQEEPQIIDISCSSSSPSSSSPYKREQVSCKALLRGGEPDEWNWRGGDSDGDREVYNTSFDTSGRKTVSLTVRNSAGSDSDDRDVTVINRRPERVGSIAGVTVDVDGSESVNVSGNFRDPDGDRLTYEADSDNSAVRASVSGATVTVTGSREGSATITVTADDGDGGTAIQTFRVTVTAPPDDAPEINSISCSPSTVATSTNVNCTVSLSDSSGTPDSYSWSGGDSSGSSTNYSPSWSSEGAKTVSLTVSNSAGSDDDSTTVTVMTPPSISSLGCPSSATVNQAVTCSPSVSGTGPLTYSWSGGDSDSGQSGSTYSPSWSSAGSEAVSLTVRNAVDSDSDSNPVTVSDVPPVGPVINSISCSPSSPSVNQSVTCTASLSGGAPDSYSWSGGASSGGSSSYSTSFSSSGTKTVRLSVQNSAGSDSGSTTVTVPPEPPVITVSCSPRSIDEGDRVRCTVSNSGGSIDTYSWSASGGSPSSGSSSTYRPRFNTAGTYTVSLTARNTGGSDDDTYRSITVTVEEPDIEISCSPSSIDEGESVRCSVLDNDGGEISTYSWSASGGSPSSGSSSTYRPRFNTAGTYTVSLTARNAGGSDSDTYRSITVIAPVTRPEGDISCDPRTIEVGWGMLCKWTWTGGSQATSFVWSGGGGNYSSNSSSPVVRFSSSGWKTVRVDASNSAGSDSDSLSIRVVPTPPSSLYARCGSDAIKVYWFDRTFRNPQKRHLDITGDEATRIFGRAWWNTIGHMSQSACDLWPTGSRLTGRPPS